MSKPIRQHFIPRSYLNNFAKKEDEKYFIYCKERKSDQIKPLSTKDICVNKNLYTIPNTDDNKFAIENFYADNIDGVFPEVYDIIKDKSILKIDVETRQKIIKTSLSLFFRTPKFLNFQNQLFEEVIANAFSRTNKDSLTVLFHDEELTINRKEANQIIKERKEHNRIKFLSQHLEFYERLIKSKVADNLAVYHINDNSEFITSDNPVIIRPYADITDPNFDSKEYYNRPLNPFDSLNMIHLPVDSKTILTILPSIAGNSPSMFQRMEIGIIDVIVYNSDIERNSEMWILGSKSGLKSHTQDQIKFNDEKNPKNLRMVEEYKDKSLAMTEFYKVMEKYGVRSKQVKNKIIELQSKPHIAEDYNFKSIVKRINEET